MTRPFKRTLDFDSTGSNRASSFPYQRAALNGALKTELVNDCLSDAVVYSGQHGDVIRGAVKLAVCHELRGTCRGSALRSGTPNRGDHREPGQQVSVRRRPRGLPRCGSDPRARAMNQRFASIQTIYLMANQIPLLDFASPMSPASSLDEMVDMMHAGRMAMAAERATTMAIPTVVASLILMIG